jgi:radical SAM protein with 4Fe4S-binding SPASM domain
VGEPVEDIPLPVHLQVEVTGACNLRCRMCLVGHRPPIDRRSGSLDPASFRALLDGLPSLRSLTLQGLGEPLLAPHLAEMITLAKARGLETGFNTNGTLLDARHRRMLLDLGVDWAHVSVDAATPAVFEGIRLGADFHRVVGNLRALVAERGARRHPRIQLNAVLMRRTVAELAGLVRLAADLGVDRLWVQQLSHDLGDTTGRPEFASLRAFTAAECLWSGEGTEHQVGPGREATEEPFEVDELRRVRDALAEAARLARELGLEIRLPDLGEAGTPRPAEEADRAASPPSPTAEASPGADADVDVDADHSIERSVPRAGTEVAAARPPSSPLGGSAAGPVDALPCDWPWRSSYVNHDGRVQPCCMLMGDDRAVMGTVHQPGGFAAVWNGPDYAEFRRRLLGPEPPEVCRGCAQYRHRF